MEWMIQEENLFVLANGVEGVTYTMGENGLPVVDGAYMGDVMLNHNMNIDMTCLVHASKAVDTIEDSIKAVAPQSLPQDFTQMMIDTWTNETKAIADAGTPTLIPSSPWAIESEYIAPLLSLYQEYYAKLPNC